MDNARQTQAANIAEFQSLVRANPSINLICTNPKQSSGSRETSTGSSNPAGGDKNMDSNEGDVDEGDESTGDEDGGDEDDGDEDMGDEDMGDVEGDDGNDEDHPPQSPQSPQVQRPRPQHRQPAGLMGMADHDQSHHQPGGGMFGSSQTPAVGFAPPSVNYPTNYPNPDLGNTALHGQNLGMGGSYYQPPTHFQPTVGYSGYDGFGNYQQPAGYAYGNQYGTAAVPAQHIFPTQQAIPAAVNPAQRYLNLQGGMGTLQSLMPPSQAPQPALVPHAANPDHGALAILAQREANLRRARARQLRAMQEINDAAADVMHANNLLRECRSVLGLNLGSYDDGNDQV